MLRRIWTILGKEMLDTLRDRRTLIVMILVPVLLMPVFTLLPQVLLGGQLKQPKPGSLVIEVYGVANGPQLVEFMRQKGAEIRPITTDPVAYVRDNRGSVIVVIAPDFQPQLVAEKPAQVSVILDDSNMASGVTAGRLQEMLTEFGRQIAAQRLQSRGLDPEVMTPVKIQRQNVATEQQMGGAWLGMFVPMFLILFAFLGGMYTAIDVTAGEKERGTLEPLLTAPVGRVELVIGKLLTVFATSFAAVVLSLLSTYAAFRLAPQDLFGSGMSFALGSQQLLLLILVSLPLTVFLNGIEMVICIFARSFKEAQNYVTPLQLILMLPAFVVGFMPNLKLPVWSYAVPALGQMAIFRDILGGTALNGTHLTISLASAGLYALVAIAAALATFSRETVLFRT